MIKTITFKKKYRCFGKGRRLMFQPGVNLLVGDQGTGKSSLLRLLKDLSGKWALRRDDVQKIITVESESAPVMCFDFEKDNPRVKTTFGETADEFRMGVSSMFVSHGEFVRRMLESLESVKEPTVILLDEPDTGLSPRSACKFRDGLKKIAKKGHQVLASVHSPIIIGAFPKVLSLEHKRWVTPEKYLRDHGLTGETPWA